jgi:hypothetical protein
MLDNVSGYAVDKAKFALELGGLDFIERKLAWESVFGDIVGPQGGKSYNVVSVKKGAVADTYLYIFDVWGEAAQYVDELDFEHWYPHLDRLDLKVGMPITPEGQHDLYLYLMDKVGRNRSVDLRQSPIRQKRGNRDAGGKTLSLGSHKSDLRIHWTQRGQETGYQEFQVQHDKLANETASATFYRTHPEYAHEPIDWQWLAQTTLTHAQLEMTDITGLYDYEIARILDGTSDSHAVLEQRLARIEKEVGRLPKDAIWSLFEALRVKLFEAGPTDDDGVDNSADATASPM